MQANDSKLVRAKCKDQFFGRVAVVLFINTIVCSIVALFLWLAVPKIGEFGFFSSWVYSQCIGQLICIGFILYSSFQRSKSIQPNVSYFFAYPIIVLAGFYFGKNIAAFITADSTESYVDGSIFWTTLLVTACVSVASIWFYNSRERLATLKMVAAEEAARASEAKLHMLQAQVEPHMLFNTLSNLRSLIDSDPRRAMLMLDTLVDFLRATLNGSMRNSTTLSDEFELLESYLSLMQIRLGSRLTFDLHLPANLEKIVVPILILQPLVENAIKHGIEPSLDGGRINVRARAHGQYVEVEVMDTGVGYAPSNAASTSGFGLHSVQERLQSTGLKDALTIVTPLSESEQGTSIIIRVPMSSTSLTNSDLQ